MPPETVSDKGTGVTGEWGEENHFARDGRESKNA